MSNDKSESRSVRFDKELLKEANKLGISVTATAQAALAQAVRDKRCPYCGHKLKVKKGD